jgi:uroporphyrinogen-III synthase
LCAEIEAAGGRALHLPALEIRKPQDRGRLKALLDRVTQFDIAIFVSANAVTMAMPAIRARDTDMSRLKVAAIGQKTAQALAAFGTSVDICPRQGYTSEALLELEEMQKVDGQCIVVFRGEGGRELLAETLRSRGAQVEYAQVYRRVAPRYDQGVLARCLDGGFDIVAVTSIEALQNLDNIVGPSRRARLRGASLLVGGQRMLKAAHEMGFAGATAARDPSDEAMLEALQAWAGQHPRSH